MLLNWKALVFPLALGANVLIGGLAVRNEVVGTNVVPLLAGFSLLCAWLAQTSWPFSAAPGTSAERRTDWLFFALTSLVDSAVVATFEHVRLREVEVSFSPASVLLALGAWEFGSYWAHRLGHASPLLWRFHALHHAPERLTVLNNFRLHPFDLIVKDTLALGAVGFCGFDASTLLLVAVVKNCVVAFQHADADLRHGWLSLVVSTNAAHRWHHSTRPEEANANFGTVLLFWDAVFGTLRFSDDENAPQRVGLFGLQYYPRNQFFTSLVSPFCWGRCTVVREAPQRAG